MFASPNKVEDGIPDSLLSIAGHGIGLPRSYPCICEMTREERDVGYTQSGL